MVLERFPLDAKAQSLIENIEGAVCCWRLLAWQAVAGACWSGKLYSMAVWPGCNVFAVRHKFCFRCESSQALKR